MLNVAHLNCKNLNRRISTLSIFERVAIMNWVYEFRKGRKCTLFLPKRLLGLAYSCSLYNYMARLMGINPFPEELNPYKWHLPD